VPSGAQRTIEHTHDETELAERANRGASRAEA